MGLMLCWSIGKSKQGPIFRMLSVVAKKTEKHCDRCYAAVSISTFSQQPPTLLSPVSLFQTNSTPINLCKGRNQFAARIGNNNFKGCSSPDMVLHEHSFLPFSWQPLIPLESRFKFEDRLNHKTQAKTENLLLCK
jgi:hypothetical protein